MRAILTVILLAGPWLAAVAGAEGTDPLEDGVLTLAEAWSLTRSYSPGLAVEDQRVEAARLRRMASSGDLLPQVQVGARYTRLSDLDPVAVEVPGLGSFTLAETIQDNFSTSLSVDQPLFTGFALASARRRAGSLLEAARENRRLARTDLRLNLEEVYLGESTARGMLRAVEDALTTLRAHREVVVHLEEVGLATRLDGFQLETRLAELGATRVEVASTVELTRLALHFLTGIPPGQPFELSPPGPDGPEESELLDPLQLVEEALAGRPEMRALMESAEAMAAAARIEAAPLYPQLGLHFGYQYDRPNQRIFPQEDQFDETWDASVALSWRLWDFGATANRARAARREHQAVLKQVDQVRDVIRLDVAQRMLELRSAGERLRAAILATQAAEEELRVARERFQVGDAAVTDVLDGEASATEARFRELQARSELRLARSRLRRSVGRDLDG